MTRKTLTSLPGLPCLRRRRRLAIVHWELGPWGYLPTDPASLRAALEQHQAVVSRRHDL
ncbi:hypothetical protein LNQ52_24620 [Klebsiella pneumoniae subsp. pneumoniae]|nr:hypothetical protein [Klebsiella pneumoniae subsp. pneumoniae]